MSGVAVVVPGRKLLPGGLVPPILEARIEAAVGLCLKLAEEKNVVLILCGGKVPQSDDELTRLQAEGADSKAAAKFGELQDSNRSIAPPLSEAEAMLRMVLKKGLNPEKVEVLLDTNSVNTLENAVFARQLVEPRNLKQLYIVNSTFHMPRAKKSFELMFEGVDGVTVETLESSDASLTEAERERENIVEPAMMERLPAHARIYQRHLSYELDIEEARQLFFQRDEVHSDVWLLPIPDPEL
eukprot:TRINITY_DN2665_c7_g1_i1.p1 TRINITY_DN2665_c7_g1~~TRINITY_DN2665_c7_g1_i1.p1  ORF type:complete len:262 (+),score=61.08 TRINITY_DN2665_c7_g1_i1:65-787(+)